MMDADMPNDTAPNARRKVIDVLLNAWANLPLTALAPRRGVAFLAIRPPYDAGDKQREKQIEYGYLQIVIHFGGSGRGIQWVGLSSGPLSHITRSSSDTHHDHGGSYE
jgi:hypothetical protein